MKKITLILALILCLALTVFAFASCSKKSADATTADPGTTPATTVADPTSAEATTPEATAPEATTPEATTPEATEHVHTPATEYTIDTPATCGAPGSKSYHCTECGQIVPETVVEIPADASAHDVPSWTVTKKPTLLDQAGSRHGECSACHQDVVEELAFEPTVYNPADLSNYEGDKSQLLLSKTLPEILGGDHFYPTETTPEGKALYFDLAILWNETLANLASDCLTIQPNYKGKGGRTFYYFYTRDNVPDAWCLYAGGFDYGTTTAILYGPEGGNGAPKENFPNLGEYGWHNVGVKVYQTASIVEGAVSYKVVSTLYIDGVKVWELDHNISRLESQNCMLWTATVQDGDLSYTDAPENLRFQLRGDGINDSPAPLFFIYSDETWSVVDADFEPAIVPVADPEAKTYTTDTGIEMPAAIYFAKPCDEHVWDGEFTVTKKATLLDEGEKVEHCSVCGVAHKVAAEFVPTVYNPADLSNYDGDKSMLLLSKTLPDILNGEHFYPTEENPEGKDAYFELAILWNETMANFGNDEFYFCLNYQGGAGSNLFYFTPKDNSNSWCKYAGGFDYGRGKGDTPVIFGPAAGNGQPKENYPNVGEYGWHKIGVRMHQAAALDGDTVVYSGTSYLYIDGELVWKIDLDMAKITSDKNLLFTATNNEGTLVYADNENANKVRVQLRGEKINNSTAPFYFIFGDVSWSVVDADFEPAILPVAAPEAKVYTTDTGIEMPAAIYFTNP